MGKATAGGYRDDTITAYRKAFEERMRRKRMERERRRQEALTAVKQAVRAVAPSYPTLRRVYLYGSVTRRGAFHRDSDIDVAVEGLDGGEYFDLWRDLEQTANLINKESEAAPAPRWKMDVRPLKPDDPFSDKIRQRGMIIYE